MISVHLIRDLGLRAASVPLVQAGAMLVEVAVALVTGRVDAGTGSRVLFVGPAPVALVPVSAFGGTWAAALLGVAAWAAASGVQDSAIKALVAELVPAPTSAAACSIFAAIQGAPAIDGGFVAGHLLDRSVPALVAVWP